MADPYIGEIRIVGFNFAPVNWATCDGQILSISQNVALFSLLGVNFGGNGQTTFGLPDLRGRAPMHWQQGPGLSDHYIGQTGGEAAVTLNTTQLPAHTHTLQAERQIAADVSPGSDLFAGIGTAGDKLYSNAPPAHPGLMAPQAVSTAGGSQPHNNLAPYQTLLTIICLAGIYPSRG